MGRVRVAFPGLKRGLETELRPLLEAGVELADADCDLLVAGHPAAADLDAHPRLQAVIVPFAGVPESTRDLARARGLALHNLHHNAAPTAETAVALLLAAAKELLPLDRALRAGDWRPRNHEPGLLLEGKTVLILGYGEIGRRVGAACAALGMEVAGVRRADAHKLPELLPRAHALVLCLPATERTRGIVGARELALLPEGAIVVNVGRGDAVDEDALFDALASGRLSGAGLDVWWRYPEDEAARANTRPATRPFHELGNVVMSPHRGGLARGVERLRAQHLARLLNAAARGEPLPNPVDADEGY